MGTAPALPNSVCRLGFIPGYLFGGIPANTEISLGYGVTCSLGGLPAWFTVLSSMFMHGGWMHLIGNVWFLWVLDRKSTRLNSSHSQISYAVFCLKKKRQRTG